MDIALIADLHGNWPAVQAVDADLKARGITEIYCLGDMVGKGPSNKLTLDWAVAHSKVIVAGNWDLNVLNNESHGYQFFVNQLTPSDIDLLGQLPLEHSFWFSSRHVRLLHGRPIMPLVTTFEEEEEYFKYFVTAEADYSVLCYADLHQPAFRIIPGDHCLINTGSVGNALNDTRAHYVILSGEMGAQPAPFNVTMISIEYDREQAIRDAQLAHSLPKSNAYINELKTGIYSRN